MYITYTPRVLRAPYLFRIPPHRVADLVLYNIIIYKYIYFKNTIIIYNTTYKCKCFELERGNGKNQYIIL